MTENLVDRFLPTSKSFEQAIMISTHEILHEVVNNELEIQNTAFTEALFDVLCGRKQAGLWFGKQCFEAIQKLVI